MDEPEAQDQQAGPELQVSRVRTDALEELEPLDTLVELELLE